MSYTERVKVVMEEKKISQADLMRATGQSKQNIHYRITNEKFESLEFLEAICLLGDTNFEYLINGTEELKYFSHNKLKESIEAAAELRENLATANKLIKKLEKENNDYRAKVKESLGDIDSIE